MQGQHVAHRSAGASEERKRGGVPHKHKGDIEEDKDGAVELLSEADPPEQHFISRYGIGPIVPKPLRKLI